MAFSDLLNFTYGELREYIEYHRKKERRKLQEECIIAYYQSLFISKIITEGEIGEVFEYFPFWTEDEILDIRANEAVNYFSKFK